MVSFTISSLLVNFVRVACAVDLLSALRASDASTFADKITQNDDLRALYLDPRVQTVFVPVDSVFLNQTSLAHVGALRIKEDARDNIGVCETQSGVSSGNSAQLLNVFNPPNSNTENGKLPIVFAGTSAAPRVKRNPEAQLEVISGLGDKVSVVRSFIEYDGGYLHTIDGHLTVPVRLSRTLATLKDTTAFGSVINSSNLTTSLDTQKGGTFFIPNNDAMCAIGNRTLSPNAIQGHVIKGYSAYLPLLAECQSFTSASGDVLRVSKSPDGSFYINNAKILSTNIILENGVAYIIDRVLAAPNIPPLNNAAPSTNWDPVKSIGGFAFMAGTA